MKKLFFLFVLAGLIFSGCKETTSVITQFKDEIPTNGNLSFEFDKDMVQSDMLNKWDTTAYLTFEPEIRGKFKWETQRKLVFSPYRYFKPATDYKIIFSKKFFKDDKLDKKEISVHTSYVKILSTNVSWIAGGPNNSKAFVKFDITLNYATTQEDLLKFLQVMYGNTICSLTPEDKNSSTFHSFFIENIPVLNEDINLDIIVRKGLKVFSGAELKDDYITKAKLYSPAVFAISGLNAQHDGFTGIIQLTTTQAVADKNIKDFIEIKPKVNFTTEVDLGVLVIKSQDFDINKHYEVTVKKDLPGVLGGKLKYEYTDEIGFGSLESQIKFIDTKGMYIMSGGNKNLEIKLINVPELRVSISKVYENNIVSYFGSDYNYGYYDEYEYDDYDYYYSDGEPGNLGDEIWSQTYNSKDLPALGENRILNINFKDKIGSYNGIYVIEAYSTSDYWVKARKAVSISDIGLIAKAGMNSISVFANSIETTNTIAGVNLKFVGKNNQIVGKATTDANGMAVFNIPPKLADGFEIRLITAEKNGDFNYLPFSKTAVGTSRFDVGGKNVNPEVYEAFIYGERELYRPGETINMSAILRDFEWKTPGKIPVIVKFVSPNGKIFKTVKKTLNEQGSFEASFELGTAALTGTYTAEVYSSTEVLLNSKYFQVEEFMPDRIKAVLTFDKPELQNKDSLNININVQNLFGTPATDRNYELFQRITRKSFYPKSWSGYNFSITGIDSYFDNVERYGTTDKTGNANEGFTPLDDYQDMGILRADYFLTVFDETGRPIHRAKSIDIYTQNKFFGINLPESYVHTDKIMQIPIVAIDKSGNALNNTKANVTVLRHDYKTVLAKSGSYFKYKSEHELVVEDERNLTLNGKDTKFNFTPKKSGNYEIRISDPNSKSYVVSTFYAYGFGKTTTNSFKVNNEGNIDIVTDKETYKTGDKAKIMLKTPFEGKVLITVESNNVLKSFYKETDKRALEFDLDIIDSYVPNVYVSATLFRKNGVTDLPLTVAHGFMPILVDNSKNKLPLTISCSEKTESKTKQTIKIKTAPGAMVTIAAVDEGILLVNNSKTPKPYDFFYQKRKLAVNSYDIYPFLFPEISIKSGKAGGGEGDMSNRVNPVTNKRVKLVSFWSGILKADASGNVNYQIDIPQFSGNIKIMAVAYKDKAFASADKGMIVADPVIISTGLPRFLTPGDLVDIPVTVTNTTNSGKNCNIKIEITGPVELVGDKQNSISIEASSEIKANFKMKVKQEIGNAKVTVSVNDNSKNYQEEIEITVRPASTLQKVTGFDMIPGGQSKALSLNTSKFMPVSIQRKLTISDSPLLEFNEDLAYLLQYPHGCVEQTVSSVFPQLYYTDLAKSVFKGTSVRKSPNENINEAIRKLQMMQIYNGALTYWQGGGDESWWGTVYAGHFLIEAKKAGYSVDNQFMDDIFSYLRSKVREKNTITFFYNRDKNKKIAPKELAYSLYVLALAGKQDMSSMNYYKANRDLLSLDSKYLLAASYALAGDKEKFAQILPVDFSGEESVQTFSGSFNSQIRDLAISLNAVLDTDPDNIQIPVMARQLSQLYKTDKYLNTQERVFTFLAMGKIARKSAKSNLTASIKVGGKEIDSYTKGTLSPDKSLLNSDNISIDVQGTGNVYYFYEVQGISSDGSYTEEDHFLKVRRAFYERNGNLKLTNTFKQNELVVVEISISGSQSTNVENVAITDLLPACFEIENPRISSVSGLNSKFASSDYADYMDIRDDRISFFTDVNNKTKKFYYLVRVVSTGEYNIGPINADAMYNGEYHSYNGAGKLLVSK